MTDTFAYRGHILEVDSEHPTLVVVRESGKEVFRTVGESLFEAFVEARARIDGIAAFIEGAKAAWTAVEKASQPRRP